MDMRGGSRDGAVNRTLESPEGERDDIVIENAEIVSPGVPSTHALGHSHSHTRGPSESQNLLPNSPKNLFEYSSTKRYTFNQPDSTRYDPRSAPRINGRETPMWSGVPQSLRKSSSKRWQDAAIDLLAILASMPFFALASALIWVDGEEAGKDKENSLDQLIKGAATLFPLIFSVVVGRTMVKIASWKVERGTSIGLLERLLGSRTVGGTIITAIGLRSITIGSLILILLWLLSPLGSQSILRILSTVDGSTTTSANVTYINARQRSYSGQAEFNNWSNGLASIVSASLVAPEEVKTGLMDTWGNVKIPLLSSLSNIPEDENGWRQISQTNATSYSSLLGIPISNVGNGNSTFNLESTYTELTCSNRTSNLTRGSGFFIDSGLISTAGPFIAAQNITSSTAWAIGYLGNDVTYSLPNSSIQALNTLPTNISTNDILPGLLIYQDFTGTSNVTSIYCVPSQTYVESSVTCTSITGASPSCAVTAQRLSLLPNLPSEITPFSISALFRGISSYLPATTPQLNHVDIMQNYIYSPLDNSFIQSAQYPMYSSPGSESRFLDLPLPEFSLRLGQILNTIIQGTTANHTTYLTSSPSRLTSKPTSQPLLQTPQDLTTQLNLLSPTLTVPSQTHLPTKIFSISYTYLTLFLLSTSTLLLTSLTSIFLTQLTHLSSTSYLTHLSSLLRDSPRLPIPSGGVNLSSFKRAREVGEMRVRLGDVGNVGDGFEIGVGAAVVVGRVGLGLEGEKDGRGGVRGLGGRKLYL